MEKWLIADRGEECQPDDGEQTTYLDSDRCRHR